MSKNIKNNCFYYISVLCKQLAKMNIMSPLSGLDELGAIKTQYKQSFAKLLHTCVTHLKLVSINRHICHVFILTPTFILVYTHKRHVSDDQWGLWFV